MFSNTGKIDPQVKSLPRYNPAAVLCDTIPQANHTVHSELLKQSTDDLIHSTWFNATIFKYPDLNGVVRHFLCYRTDQFKWCTNPRIHLVMTNDMFRPIGKNITLNVNSNVQGWRVDYRGTCNEQSNRRAEDPRILVDGEDIIIWWTDGFKMYRGFIGLLFDENGLDRAFIIDQSCPKPPYIPALHTDPRYDGREKNWTPISKDLVIYSFEPFVIYDVVTKNTVANIQLKLNWKHGFIKGGTPAVPFRDGYLTIFHSSKKVGERGINHYYAGALVMDKSYRPIAFSRYPIIAPYPDDDHCRHNEAYVVFPCGLIVDDSLIYISYGYNDHSIKIHTMTHNQLDYNLRDIHDSEFTTESQIQEPDEPIRRTGSDVTVPFQ